MGGKGQQGDAGRGHGGIVGAFAGADPFRIPGAEAFGVLVHLLHLVIGHQARHLGPGSGDDADDGAQDAADGQRTQVMDMLLDDLAQQAFLDLGLHSFEDDMGVFHHLDHLGHGEKADERRDDGDAGGQGLVEDETAFPGDVALTDAGKQQAQRAAEKALEHGA